jgi:hypothetical protein
VESAGKFIDCRNPNENHGGKSMKKTTLLSIAISFVLTACNQSGPAPAAGSSTSAPDNIAATVVSATAGPATVIPTAVPTVKADTPTLPATSAPTDATTVKATDTLTVSSVTPTTAPIRVEVTHTLTVSPVTPTKVRPRPTATSSGPLTFEIYVAGCQSAPTAAKPAGVIIAISIEARGGNGIYKYFDNEGVQHSSKFIDISWAKGSALIGKVTVTSGDGQTVEKEYYINLAESKCP